MINLAWAAAVADQNDSTIFDFYFQKKLPLALAHNEKP